jgi:hypothetical protein
MRSQTIDHADDWLICCYYDKHRGLPWTEVLKVDRGYVQRIARGVGGAHPLALRHYLYGLLGWSDRVAEIE